MSVLTLPQPWSEQQLADRWKRLLEGDAAQQRTVVLEFARDAEAQIRLIDDALMHGGRDGHGVPFRDLGEMRRRRNRMVDILERIHNEFSRWYQNREYVKVGTAWDLVREVMRLAAQAGR